MPKHAIRTEIAELQSRLMGEPNGPTVDVEADCARVGELKSNPIATLFKSDELTALAKRCDQITSRDDAPASP